jgi:hypothetical protein
MQEEEFGSFEGPNISRGEVKAILDRNPLSRGSFAGAVGIGFVRIDGTDEDHWVAVNCTTMPKYYCPRHGKKLGQPMSLQVVKTDTSQNIRLSVFYKCNEQIRISKDRPGTQRCGFNMYPSIDSNAFKAEDRRRGVNNRLWIPPLQK